MKKTEDKELSGGSVPDLRLADEPAAGSPPASDADRSERSPHGRPTKDAPSFPIVGIGASAGGLEALRRLFADMPAEPGIAFVVIQHLDPERPSMLAQVLAAVTRMRVVQVKDMTAVEQNCVHVIPSGSDLLLQHGLLALVSRRRSGALHLPIDSFFRSLAEQHQDRAIGVVLSGAGADGTDGLRALKGEGGIAIAQKPESALFRSMPESAIAAGVVDFLGTPSEIAAELLRLSRHPYIWASCGGESEPDERGLDEDRTLAPIFALMRQRTRIDFSGYKRTTVLRRIERRMALRRVTTLEGYARALRDEPGEALALARDMLIHVTSYFRDPEAFEALKEHVFRNLVLQKEDGGSIRVWIPGCSTGEEVYAVTICLLEALDELPNKYFSIKVFGSDLSEEAVEIARLGLYSEAALAGVSSQRLSRFFERVEGQYGIKKHVRELCVFVKHDLIRDPPFAKLDLISCRNVLIYFDTELQRRVIPILHYCLNEQGHLFLGQSEAIMGFSDLFAPVDKEHRIFVKTGDSSRLAYPPAAGREAEAELFGRTSGRRRHSAREVQKQADHILLSRYAPPGVIVNDRLEIVQFRGRTGAYLEPPPGQPQVSLLRMAREGLVAYLHDMIERAKAQSASVRMEGLQIQAGSEIRVIDLEVMPLATMSDSSEHFFLVLFEEAGGHAATLAPPPVRSIEPGPATQEARTEAERLRTELVTTKDYLQALISEHQMTTDDLASANEELLAANEELQSANEELQSAKEELQSVNEELSTVNDQLRNRNEELDQVANDLANVLSSVEIPVIIVDLDLRVRRFTPTVRNIAGFIPEDLGRPIDDLKLRVQVDDLPRLIKEVVDTLSLKEWEVRRQDGRWFRMQIRPYRTADKRLDGAVLSFIDVDALKQARLEAERANSAKDFFLATLSHELRTPLSTLLMSAQMLKRVAAGDHRIARASASIERSAIAQSKIVEDLLDVSRIASGKLILDLGPVDLAAVAQDGVEAARTAAQAKSLEIELIIEGSIGLVYGDPMRLQQVISNLLTNAIKFTPHGGRVVVRLERSGEQARLSVSDTGVGISPEVLPRLFSRFVQADSSVTRTHGGLGLGLSIVRHLVEIHGGEVHAESPGEGKGATFSVTLPLGSADVAASASAQSPPTRDIKGVRVLLVEDDDDAREAYEAMLVELGAVVRAASSARAGLSAFLEFRPQVILSDVAMPGEDGFSFIQRVRRLGPDHGGEVPAAALTALASEKEKQQALQAGFQMHVAKPLDAARLAAVVHLLADWTHVSDAQRRGETPSG